MKRKNLISFIFFILLIVVCLVFTTILAIKGNFRASISILSMAISLVAMTLSMFGSWITKSQSLFNEIKQQFNDLESHILKNKINAENVSELMSMPIMKDTSLSLEEYQAYLKIDLLYHYKAPQELVEKLKQIGH